MAFSSSVQFDVFVGDSPVGSTGGGGIAPTNSQSTATFPTGETVTFDRAMPVGYFVTGEPFVVADQPFEITQWTPVSVSNRNGVVLNPSTTGDFSSAEPQGFDIFFETPTLAIGNSSVIPYSSALNLDPGNTGSNISIAQGAQASYVKSIRRSGAVAGDVDLIEDYDILTILPTTPPENPYRPGHAHTIKTIRSRTDVDWEGPRNYAWPAQFSPLAEAITFAPTVLASFHSNAEKVRYMRLENAMSSVSVNNGYSLAVVPFHAQYIMALNAVGLSGNERQGIIDWIITHTNDLESVLDSGGSLSAGAGQGGARWLWAMAGAALLKDNVLHQKIRNNNFQPQSADIVKQSDTLLTPGQSSGSSNFFQPWLNEQVGLPRAAGRTNVDGWHTARYNGIGHRIAAIEVAAVCTLNQGPPGFSDGAAMLLNGGPNDATNDAAALMGVAELYQNWVPDFAQANGPDGFSNAAWDLAKAGGATPYTSQPDQPPIGSTNADLGDNYFSAGGGSITLNTQGAVYATETVTRRDMRYSLDAVQWIEETGITLSGNTYTKTGLVRGAQHWCGWRQVSASGVGAWSTNAPFLAADAGNPTFDRSTVTPSGSQSNAAPVFTTDPAICTRIFPQWEYELWEQTTNALETSEVELAAGVGYFTCHPAPSSYGYQWQRSDDGVSGWSDVATTKTYTRTINDSGKYLRCRVTVTNSQGSTSAFTNVVSVPEPTQLPAGTLIDTDWGPLAAVDYAAEIASYVDEGGYTGSHQPAGTLASMPGNQGYFLVERTGGNLSGRFQLSRAAEAFTTYNITLQHMMVWGRSNGVYYVDVLDGSDNLLFRSTIAPADFGDGTFFYKNGNRAAHGVKNTVGTFTTQGNTTLIIRISAPNVGGPPPSGGDQSISQLTIAAA